MELIAAIEGLNALKLIHRFRMPPEGYPQLVAAMEDPRISHDRRPAAQKPRSVAEA